MTWTVALVPTEAIEDLWPTVEQMLAPAMEYAGGRIDLESVREWLADRRYLLWIAYPEDKVIRAAFVTREARYPRRSMLVVEIAGGTGMRRWVTEATRVFRSYSRDIGFDGVEMFGRPGWSRALRAYGWEESCVLVEIETATDGAA